MIKIFNGQDVVIQSQVIKASSPNLQTAEKAKEWEIRTLFLVKDTIYWYTSKAEWKNLLVSQVTEIKTLDLQETNEEFPFGLLLTTISGTNNYIWGFKTIEDRVQWITLLRCITLGAMYQTFVNPGITQLHIMVLCRALLQQDHPQWHRILQHPTQYAKEMRYADSMGVTPLHIAAYTNQLTEAKLFVQNGSFINCQMDYRRLTPLHLSLLGGCFNVFDLLLEFGANCDIQGENGESVADIVRKEFQYTKYDARLFKTCYIELEPFQM